MRRDGARMRMTAVTAAPGSAAMLQWHLERGLRSLPLVDRSDARPAVLQPAEPLIVGTRA